MTNYNVTDTNNVKLVDMLTKPVEAAQILLHGLSATGHIVAGCFFENQSHQVDKLVKNLEKIPKLFAEGFFIPLQLANSKVSPIRSKFTPIATKKQGVFSKLFGSQESSDEATPKDGLCSGAIRPFFLIALAGLDDMALQAKKDGQFLKEKSISWLATRFVAAAFGISMLATRTADAAISMFAIFATILSFPLSYKFDLHALHHFTYHSFSSLKLIADLAFIGIKILLPSTDTQTVYHDIDAILREQVKAPMAHNGIPAELEMADESILDGPTNEDLLMELDESFMDASYLHFDSIEKIEMADEGILNGPSEQDLSLKTRESAPTPQFRPYEELSNYQKFRIHQLNKPETTIKEFNEMRASLETCVASEPDFSGMDQYQNAQVLS